MHPYTEILSILFNGELIGSHNQANSGLFMTNRIFWDPWEWYTSLWAHGCDKNGEVYELVTRRKSESPKEWLSTYGNGNNPVAFRAWQHMMHEVKYWRSIGEGCSVCLASRMSGLMTFRYSIVLH